MKKSLGKKTGLFNGEIPKNSETTAPNKVTDSTVFLLIVLHVGRWE